ncbi:MAG: efflux RND transporter periplasmic adaptor subunit [Hyphomicrobium sp.]
MRFGLAVVLQAVLGLAGVEPARAGSPPATPAFSVAVEQIDDLKSVYAMVRSKDLIEARVRTPGTVAKLNVDEGTPVEPGQVLALVADPKIALKIKSIDAQILAIKSRLETAKTELERSETLKSKGVSPQARVDQAQTAFDVATNDLKATQAERSVVMTQIEEGQVLAPAAGRVLKVPVTEGSVVLNGESIATIAANVYLLRLELPERLAQFMKSGDTVRLGERGMSAGAKPLNTGRIVQVYPELQNGRVIADAEVPGLGSYFVGERVLVWISAGKRDTYIVPRSYVFKRFGLDYVRLAGRGEAPASDAVVQLGRAVSADAEKIEILAGVKAGDVLVQP